MSPVFGFLVDKLGRNIIWVLFAVVATLASHIMLAFTFWNPWIAMVILANTMTLIIVYVYNKLYLSCSFDHIASTVPTNPLSWRYEIENE